MPPARYGHAGHQAVSAYDRSGTAVNRGFPAGKPRLADIEQPRTLAVDIKDHGVCSTAFVKHRSCLPCAAPRPTPPAAALNQRDAARIERSPSIHRGQHVRTRMLFDTTNGECVSQRRGTGADDWRPVLRIVDDRRYP